ncbi:alpha/beta hydrolase domain-containing protein [Pseudarthrobacter sp. H3Y2-7]|uniref:alpha/beta hydrolase domain-containing protein n=1 Tax=Pseudarthrobacter naphthalenicus TaxID=3031328 RepID=UPI0023B07CDF|nr:alpha/beta hydrolase domain-containing protein [Pseudarthrobacter sp. H3Y2-7]MDE8667718.1 alpha/beta hydrolase domain-containing protein [Pseudarthrobacter sp. H3Y2-7]
MTTPSLAQHALIQGPIPETTDNAAVVLEPYGLDRLSGYDYVQEEYFVSGVAADHEYATRILVRRPRDMSKFNGRALAEVSHIWGGTSVWRAYNRQLMRGGYMWVEIDSQAPSALDLIKGANTERYSNMRFIDGELASDFAATIPFTENPTPELLAQQYDEFKKRWWQATPQSFEIIAQVATALRAGLPGLPQATVRTLLFAGISQTGGVVRRFIERHHNVRRRPDGGPVFDGYLPGASGGDALPDIDVPVIEVLGEAEFQSVRWACGVSGQVRGLSHRRKDSNTFRLFEVAGMAHRETRHMSDRDKNRLRDCPLPEGAKWSTFPNSHVYNALLEMLADWSEGLRIPPASKLLATMGETDTIVRGQWGNAVGGLRTTYTDAPLSTLVAATPMGRPSWYHGHEIPLSPENLLETYGTPDEYRRIHAQVIDRMLAEGFLLAEDAEELRRTAESVIF